MNVFTFVNILFMKFNIFDIEFSVVLSLTIMTTFSYSYSYSMSSFSLILVIVTVNRISNSISNREGKESIM